MHSDDLLALSTGVLMTLLTMAMQPLTLQWWLLVTATVYVICWSALHMLLGGSRQRIVKITAIGLLAVGIPIFCVWYYRNYPASQKIMQAYFPPLAVPKPVVAPPAPPPRTEATWSAGRYDCKSTGRTPTPPEAEANALSFKSYIESWAVVNGFKTPVVTAVPGGNKAELVPLSVPPYGNVPSKRSFQIVRLGKELVGTYTAEYWPVFAGQQMPPNSALEIFARKTIAGLANVDPSDCELQ